MKIGFLGLLVIVLVVLAFTGHLSVWWLVLAPIWIPIRLIIGVLVFIACLAFIGTYLG